VTAARWTAAAAVLAVALLPTLARGQGALAAGAFAQESAGQGWDGERVRDLVARAVERRAGVISAAALQDYRATAVGHIYFLYDLGRGTPGGLVKADQLALQLYWKAPDQTRQLVVGRRQRKSLPTGIRYHLDHLTVVMDNFGDRIELGEGSEVRGVLHPAAPGALDFYQYRLADSLTLVLPQREVRVYEVQVRPRDPAAPALVGSMFLDRATADIVRLEFTFTAAAYRDRSLDYFNVRLENALWAGRYWLPYRQGIELRREFEVFDFPAGGIIRAEFRIADYRFDTGIDPAFFRGPRVSTLSRPQREAYPFEEGLYEAIDPETAVAPPSMDDIRRQATQLVQRSYLDQIEGLRPALPNASAVLRFRRGEGLYVGPALIRRFAGGVSLLVLGGYALGADRWQVGGRLRAPLRGSIELEAEGHWHRAADAGPWPSSSGALATLAALVDGEDYREPYWASGGSLAIAAPLGSARARVAVGLEEWEAATLQADDVVDRSYRPVRGLDEGDVGFLIAGLRREPAVALEAVGGSSWELAMEGSTRSIVGDFDYARGVGRAELVWPDPIAGVDLSLRVAAGAVSGGRIPSQRLFPAGGRGSVRGYAFHRFVGNLYGAAGIELRREIFYPLLSGAAFGDIGWVGVEGESARDALEVWNDVGAVAGATQGPLLGLGGGLGILFDILHVELARGLRQGGLWELVVRVRRQFWDWL